MKVIFQFPAWLYTRTINSLFCFYNHRFTPPCREQVPRLDWLKLYVPSRHSAVAPAGGVL